MSIKRLTFGLLALLFSLGLFTFPADTPTATQATSNQQSDNICTVTPFDLAGQAHYTIRGAGDSADPAAARIRPVSIDEALFTLQTSGPTPVGILVIDDFAQYRDEIAHGRFVTDLLIAVLNAHPNFDKPEKISEEPPVWRWTPTGQAQLPSRAQGSGQIFVMEVDTENFDTAQLKDHVETAVNTMQRDYGVQRMVLNMSFALIPCQTADYDLRELKANSRAQEARTFTLAQRVAQSRDLSLPDAAIENANVSAMESTAFASAAETRAVADTLTTYLETPTDERSPGSGTGLDPLHDYLKRLTGEGSYWNPGSAPLVVAVGAAGNFGRDLASFMPAAWPEVISVSATLNKSPWASSNQGQVLFTGGFYNVNDYYIIGTSFAAPVISANMAIYLTNPSVCQSPPLDLDTSGFPDAQLRRAINPRCSPSFAQ